MKKAPEKASQKRALKNFGTLSMEEKRLQLIPVVALEKFDWKESLEQTLVKDLETEQTMRNHYSLNITANQLDFYEDNLINGLVWHQLIFSSCFRCQ